MQTGVQRVQSSRPSTCLAVINYSGSYTPVLPEVLQEIFSPAAPPEHYE